MLPARLLCFLLLFFVGFHVSEPAFSDLCFDTDCNGVPIRYPFWKMDTKVSTIHCGYPDFGLNCSITSNFNNQIPVLNITGDTYYHVTEINYETQAITLVDVDVSGQTCPRPRRNVTIGEIPMVYASDNVNVSLYYNCSVDTNDGTSDFVTPNQIGCLNYGRNQSYLFVEGTEPEGFDQMICEDRVVAPVKEAAAITVENLSETYSQAMNSGFVLEWTTDKDCEACESSGGKCGFDHRTWDMVCFCSGDANMLTDGSYCKDRSKLFIKLTIGIVAGITGMLSLSMILYYLRRRRVWPIGRQGRESQSQLDIEDAIRLHGSLAPKRFSYAEVKRMTNSFGEKLGDGGFGVVYKGKLPKGPLVAVKLLNSSKGNGEEFINEVASISRTCHINIVTLLGFCSEGHKRALIYEFMCNGSLDKYIYQSSRTRAHLAWETLYQISIGIARGLEYLHRGCTTRILHFDIKPHNILLDGDFRPKISDFGLSKLFLGSDSDIVVSMSVARGTIGYIAPEVVFSNNFGGVSHKSDVYSYGMMLIEMVGGRKNIDVEGDRSSMIFFPARVYQLMEQGRNLELHGQLTPEENEIARKMTVVGLWCIQVEPSKRPSMSRVIEMLEGSLDALENPPRPRLFSPPLSP